MRSIQGNWDQKFIAWRVYRDLSNIQNSSADSKKDRLGISGGLLCLGTKAVSTQDVTLGSSLNISKKSYLNDSNYYPDLFLDMQTEKYLYAKVDLGTYVITLEYSASPPRGTTPAPITLLDATTQRFPLAWITKDRVVVDIRAVGGGGGVSSDPFEVVTAGGLVVNVTAGTIIWHDQQISVPLTAVTCAASVTTHIWLSLDDEFSAGTPVVTVNNGTAGWSGYPAQPNPPARRHWLLASVVTNGTTMTSAGVVWKGNISWTTVFGFWA